MTILTKSGVLVDLYKRASEAADWGKIAIETTNPDTRENALLETATKVAEMAAIDIPLWFVDKALGKVGLDGLDRVFDSLRSNLNFQDYLTKIFL